jgi:hypothetical protein
MSNFFHMKKPPQKLRELAAKLPRTGHALILVLDGRVENPEFVAYHLNGDNDRCWDFCFNKWKRTVYPTLARSVVDYWEFHRGELSRVKI